MAHLTCRCRVNKTSKGKSYKHRPYKVVQWVTWRQIRKKLCTASFSLESFRELRSKFGRENLLTRVRLFFFSCGGEMSLGHVCHWHSSITHTAIETHLQCIWCIVKWHETLFLDRIALHVDNYRQAIMWVFFSPSSPLLGCSKSSALRPN